MTVIESKLVECMKTVFPTVPEEKLADASIENLGQWDSLSTVTIAALIEESFEIEIAPENLVKLTSFQNIASFLKELESKKETNANG
jgi:acyl carrier protein